MNSVVNGGMLHVSIRFNRAAAVSAVGAVIEVGKHAMLLILLRGERGVINRRITTLVATLRFQDTLGRALLRDNLCLWHVNTVVFLVGDLVVRVAAISYLKRGLGHAAIHLLLQGRSLL